MGSLGGNDKGYGPATQVRWLQGESYGVIMGLWFCYGVMGSVVGWWGGVSAVGSLVGLGVVWGHLWGRHLTWGHLRGAWGGGAMG